MNKELIQDVRSWFHEKGIIQKSNTLKQLWKTQEEVTETRDAHTRMICAMSDSESEKWMHELRDGIGDVLVTLIGVCEMEEFDFLALADEFGFEPIHLIGEIIPGATLDNLQRNLSNTRDFVIMNLRRDFAIMNLRHDVQHGIGCMIYDLTELCFGLGVTAEECLQQAYDVISKRNGQMVNGIFVKEVEK